MAMIVPVAQLTLAIADGVAAALQTIQNDNKKREDFTQAFVTEARKKYPYYNVVIIHPGHSRDGVWIHQHYELPMAFGTCGYEVYFSKIGDPFSLTNDGDGGYINWAFIGYQRDGNRIWA